MAMQRILNRRRQIFNLPPVPAVPVRDASRAGGFP
jgi:hypothetical protein